MVHFNLQMFAADGHLNFDTKLDSKGFSDGIGKLGGIAKGGLAVLGASVAGVTALFAGMSKAALGSVASLEQNVGGVETLFKDSAQTVIENANNAYKTAGLSANEYMQSVTSFSASLLQSVAGDTAKAAEVADMAMVDMSDNANKMGTDMQSIQNAYQGFAKQNYTMLDNLKLGYGGTKEEMERLLVDASKFSGVKYDISSLNDVYSAIHVIQGELDITGTTALEASTTIEGSMNAAKAAYDNFLNGSGSADELADAISTAVNNVAKNLGEIIPRLAETAPKVLEALGKEFSGSAGQFIKVGTDLVTDIATGVVEGIPGAIDLAVSFIDNLAQSLNENTEQLVEAGGQLIVALLGGLVELVPSLAEFGWNIISTIINSIMENTPAMSEQGASILSQLVDGFLAGTADILTVGTQIITDLASAISSALPLLLPIAIKAILGFAQNLVNSLPALVDAGLQMLQALAEGIANSLPTIIEMVPKLINSFAETVYDSLPKILAAGVKILLTLGKGIIDSIPAIIANAGEIIKAIINVISLVNLASLGKSLISTLAKGIKGMGTALAETGGGLMKSLVTTIKNTNWIEVGKNIIMGIVNGLKNNAKKLIAAAAGVAEDALNWVKKKLGIHSPSRVFEEQVGKNIALGIADGIAKNKEYARKSAEEIAQATLDAAKKKLENYKVYNSMSLSNEVAYWDSVRQQVKEGTQARIDADKEYLTAKESLDSQLLKLDQEHADKTVATYKELNEKIQALNTQYQDAVSSRADQIASSFGLFDAFDSDTDLTADDLLGNLQGQVDGLKRWRDNLRNLEHRGISDELLAELEELGPKAAAEIQLMTEMSDDQLDEYVSLFAKKNKIARKQAVSELEPMREEISDQISQLQRETAADLAQYQKEYVSAMAELGVALNQPLETMQQTAAQNAIALVTAMANTLKEASATAENTDKFKEIAKNVLGATDTLPASMITVGQNAITAMIEGIKSMAGSLSETVTSVVGSAVNGALDSVLSGNIIQEALSGVGTVTGNTVMPAQSYGNEGYGPGYEMNYKRLGQEVSGAMNGMSVVMDGDKVGTVVAGPVNAALGSQGQVKERGSR